MADFYGNSTEIPRRLRVRFYVIEIMPSEGTYGRVIEQGNAHKSPMRVRPAALMFVCY